ncbi:MAG: hypothetical protein K2W88_00110 [Pararheinheimera sp.]|nr:hypothetical protein [Rheinheimera sp.]
MDATIVIAILGVCLSITSLLLMVTLAVIARFNRHIDTLYGSISSLKQSLHDHKAESMKNYVQESRMQEMLQLYTQMVKAELSHIQESVASIKIQLNRA